MTLIERKEALQAYIGALDNPDAISVLEAFIQELTTGALTPEKQAELDRRLAALPNAELFDWAEAERRMLDRLSR